MRNTDLFITEGESSFTPKGTQEDDMRFPEVFTNEHFRYDDNKNKKALACSDGLEGWGLCMSGKKPPKNFGEGMVKISEILKGELGGSGAIPEALMKIADTLKTK